MIKSVIYKTRDLQNDKEVFETANIGDRQYHRDIYPVKIEFWDDSSDAVLIWYNDDSYLIVKDWIEIRGTK